MIRNILLAGGIIAALISILIFSGKLPVGSPKTVVQGDVVMWGTIPEIDINPTIQTFNNQAKTYRVVYKQVEESIFAQSLLEAIANGTGPDTILAPQQVILSQASKLTPFPLTSLPEKTFKDTYVDGASLFFTPTGALALPVSIEPMVLFYNRALFSKAGIVNPPQYWDDLTKMVPLLTVINARGQFDQSAIAFGTPNTPYAKDIIMTLVSQLGQLPLLVDYSNPEKVYATVLANTPVIEGGDIVPLTTVLRFFTQFSDPTKESYTWSQFSPNAADQFVAEKLAMYIGYSGEKEKLAASNPRLDFEMATLPQTRGYNTFATGMKMYGIATLKSSKNLVAALTVESQFASGNVSVALSSAVGAVPALRTYATTPGLHVVIARSMLVARGWYDTYPRESTAFAATMISDVINNRFGPSDAAAQFVTRIQDFFKLY